MSSEQAQQIQEMQRRMIRKLGFFAAFMLLTFMFRREPLADMFLEVNGRLVPMPQQQGPTFIPADPRMPPPGYPPHGYPPTPYPAYPTYPASLNPTYPNNPNYYPPPPPHPSYPPPNPYPHARQDGQDGLAESLSKKYR